jgi:tetratricopeptide (TPR) repeat protein
MSKPLAAPDTPGVIGAELWQKICEEKNRYAVPVVKLAALVAEDFHAEEAACELLHKVLALSPDASAVRDALSALYWKNKNHAALIALYRDELGNLRLKSTSDGAREAWLCEELARLYHLAGQSEDALLCRRRLLQLVPHHLPSLHYLEEIYAAQNKWRQWLTAAQEECTSPETDRLRQIALLLAIAEVQEQQFSDFAAARAAYESILGERLDPRHIPALRGLERVLRQLGEVEALYATLNKELALQKERERIGELYEEMALLCEEKLNDVSSAVAWWQKAHAAKPRTLNPIHHLKKLYRQQEDWLSYTGMQEKEITLLTAPASLPLHKELMVFYHERLHNTAQAIAHATSALACEAKEREVLRYLEQLYAAANDKAGLAATYRQEGAVCEETGDKEGFLCAYFEAGKLYQELGEVAQAIFCLQKVVAGDDTNNQALTLLVRLLEAAKEWQRMVDVCAKLAAVTSEPKEKAELYCKMATVCAQELGDTARALTYYASALHYDSENVPALQGIRRLLLAEERWAEAVDSMTKEASLLPEDKRSPLYFHIARLWEERLAVASEAVVAYETVLAQGFHHETADRLYRLYEQLGNFPAIAALLEKEIRNTPLKSPQLPRKLLELADIYAHRLHLSEKAAEIYTALLKNDRKSLPGLQGMAEILQERREWRALLPVLKQQLQLAAGDEERTALCHRLAALYEHELDQGEQAILYYEKTVALSPSHLATIHALLPLYHKWGRFSDEVALASKELALSGDTERIEEIHRQLGELWQTRLFDPHKAIYHYQQLWELSHKPEVAQILAALYRQCQMQEKLSEILPALLQEASDSQDIVAQVERHMELGETYRELGKTEAAMAQFRQVMEIEPSHEAAFSSLAELYEEKGYLQKLVALLEDNLELASDSALSGLHLRLGQLYVRLGEQDKAIAAFEKVVAAGEERAAIFLLYPLYLEKKCWDALVAILPRAILLSENAAARSELCCLIGNIYANEKEDAKSAETWLREAVKIFPAMSDAWQKLATLASVNGRFDEAAALLLDGANHATSQARRAELQLVLGKLYENELARPQDAALAYARCLETEPGLPEAIKRLGEIYYRQKEWSKLSPLLPRIITCTPKTEHQQLAMLYYRYGEAAAALNDSDAAVARYRTAVELDPDLFAAWVKLAELHYALGHSVEALATYRKIYEREAAKEKSEHAGKALSRLAELEAKCGETASAIAHYTTWLQKEPERKREIYPRLAELYQQSGDLVEALACWERALTEEADKTQRYTALRHKAEIFAQQGDSKRAVENWLQALQYKPEDGVAVGALVELYMAGGECEKARFRNDQEYQLLQDDAARVRNRCRKGDILWQGLRQAEPAIAAYAWALNLDACCREAIDKIAAIYQKIANYAALVKAYQSFLNHLPGDKNKIGLPVHLALGYLLLEKMQDSAGALAQFAQVLELDADNEAAQLAMAEIKAGLSEKKEEAAEAHLTLLRHDPFRVPSYIALCHLLPQLDRRLLAQQAFHAVSLLEPDQRVPSPGLDDKGSLCHRRPVGDQVARLLVPMAITPWFTCVALTGDMMAKPLSWSKSERQYGIHRHEHLKQKDPACQCAAEIAKILSCREPRVYSLPGEEPQLRLLPTDPPALLLSRHLTEKLQGEELRWLIIKHLFYVAQKQLVVLQLTTAELQKYAQVVAHTLPQAEKPAVTKIRECLEYVPGYANTWQETGTLPYRARQTLRRQPELGRQLIPATADSYVRTLDFSSNHLAFWVTGSLSLSLRMLYLLHQVRAGRWQPCPEALPWQELKVIPGVRELLVFNLEFAEKA